MVVRIGFIFGLLFTITLTGQCEDLTPRMGPIEIYGARKAPVDKIRAAIGAKPGELPPARQDVEDRVDKVPGVLASRAEASCCLEKRLVLYVGIEDADGPHVDYHPEPQGTEALAHDILDNYHAFLESLPASIREKNADEDFTAGYSLMADSETRAIQEKFRPLVARDLLLIDRVLRQSADPEQRTAAAYILQYTPRGPHTTKIMVDALQYALRDPEENVRGNAMRALKAVAIGAKLHPEQEIRVEPTWFIELMNSIVFSDRRDAALALVNLTETRDAATLDLLRSRALDSVLETAKWHDLKTALPAFILAGRLAGLEEKEISQAWVAGDRDTVLAAASSSKKRFHVVPKHTN
ncbi:MAG: hypothetical protein ACJ746_30825 [Bryobacteraceae bacterium]